MRRLSKVGLEGLLNYSLLLDITRIKGANMTTYAPYGEILKEDYRHRAKPTLYTYAVNAIA